MSKRAKILVVDSDLHALSRIYLSLIHKDYRVEATDDAAEIMQRAERFKPRLLILNMSAKNLTEEIYQQLGRKRLQVLLINETRLPVPLQSHRAEELPLPLDLNFVDEKIRELLNIIE